MEQLERMARPVGMEPTPESQAAAALIKPDYSPRAMESMD
jgi:hypothetical protein